MFILTLPLSNSWDFKLGDYLFVFVFLGEGVFYPDCSHLIDIVTVISAVCLIISRCICK